MDRRVRRAVVDRRVRRAVVERLAVVEEMAERASAALSVPMVRRHIRTITGGWRELLVQHQPDPSGRCPVCSGWLRRRRWPCAVWMTAHRHLIGDVTEPFERPAQKSHPFCRPRQVVVVPRQFGAPAAERTAIQRPDQQRATQQRPAQHSTADSSPVHRAAVTEQPPAISRLRWGTSRRT
ncbi:MAG TPA: hypothetical protein VIY28_05915 [Pseudonocardiaceae bacterium]